MARLGEMGLGLGEPNAGCCVDRPEGTPCP